MFLQLKENKNYFLVGMERNRSGFVSYVENGNGETVTADYSSITEKFYYTGKKLPKYIETLLLERAEKKGYEISF
ncbi:hypothetical protein Kirov_262 [Bacillus phage Kirov]|uniref:Uncharacterized protein n=1 Tax=Bacillus phage Kirov TaxID=2783539 RepID=A0A7U3NKM6_9CAUD|nr:hypothetical protein PQE67_gp042 [Bacillus phage Kirov]QOV08461.1 hypothetical protein Kirov_262 [Bacillus phage Kirov]